MTDTSFQTFTYVEWFIKLISQPTGTPQMQYSERGEKSCLDYSCIKYTPGAYLPHVGIAIAFIFPMFGAYSGM